MRFDGRALGSSIGRNVENNSLTVTPPFGDQAHATGEVDLLVSLCSRVVLLDGQCSPWERMAVREDKSHSKFYPDFAAQTKNHHHRGLGQACSPGRKLNAKNCFARQPIRPAP